MGSKHDKKRYLIVKYQINKDGKWDELVELSKKTLGSGKLNEAAIVIDLANNELLKYNIPGAEPTQTSFEKVYEHFYKYYGTAIDQFIK